MDTLKAEIATEFVDEADPENELLIDEVYAILNDLVKEEVRRLIADEKLDLMGVNQMKLDHLNLKLVYCHEHMAQGLFTWTNSSFICINIRALGDYQLIDGLGPEQEKRFMHHYNFLISLLERQAQLEHLVVEIGHGALGESTKIHYSRYN